MDKIDVLEKVKEFSGSSTVADLINGFKELKNNGLENSQLEGITEFLFEIYKKDFDISNIDQIIKYLEELQNQYPIETVEDIEKIENKNNETEAEVVDDNAKLETKLGQEKIKNFEELLDESINASAEKKQRIEETLKRLSKNAPDEAEKIIGRIRENLKNNLPKSLFDKRNLEDITPKDEVKIVEEIVKTEKVTQEEARRILNQAEMVEAKIRVDNFVKELVKNEESPIVQKLIKIEINRVILGEKSRPEVVDVIGPIKAKILEKQTNDFIEKNPKTVRQNQLEQINEEVERFRQEAKTTEDFEQIEKVREVLIKFHNVSSPDVTTNKSRNDAQIKLEKDNGISMGQSDRALNKVQVVLDSACHTPQKFNEIVGEVNKLSGFGKKVLAGTKLGAGLEELSAKMASNPMIAKSIYGMQKIANAKIKMIEWVSKLPGMSGLSETIGGVAIKEFMAGAMKVMAEKGMLTGAKAILQGIMAGSAATAEASGASAAAVTVAGLFSALPPLAIVIIAMMIAIEVVKFAYKIYDTLAGWIQSATGVNFLWGARDFIAGIFGGGKFGKFVGTIGQVGINAMIGVGVVVGALFGPILAMGLAAMTAIITPVVVGLAGGMLVYNLLVTQPMISSIVPPPPQGAGGTCWAKDDSGTPPPSSGEINCNQNAPEVNIAISKETFGKKADAWTPGTNYADECFNDAVNRSLCAGINPLHTLAAWLHESGASNYTIPSKPNIEDFGIHGNPEVPARNFDKQINKFLTLDPASLCINDEMIQNSSISDKYWLAFSTKYLTGECDPTKLVCSNTAKCGGKSSDEMKAMVANGELTLDGNPPDVLNGETYTGFYLGTFALMGVDPPKSIQGEKGGVNCGNNGGSKPVATNDHEFVNSDGILMVCSGPVDSEGNFIGNPGESKYDPNAPGLEGEVVEGECSVSASVKSTKQCGEPWSNKSLPGGSGTICSAGCGPSSVSSILRPINGSFTPDTVIFESGSPYSNMGNEGSSLSEANSSLRKHNFTTAGVQSCSQKDIANWICQDQAVIILADSYTGSGGGTIGHILVADTVSGGKIVTKDPYYSNSTPFVTSGGIVAGQIKNLRQCLPVFIK